MLQLGLNGINSLIKNINIYIRKSVRRRQSWTRQLPDRARMREPLWAESQLWGLPGSGRVDQDRTGEGSIPRVSHPESKQNHRKRFSKERKMKEKWKKKLLDRKIYV